MNGLDESLTKITKGAGIAFVGSLFALFLAFMSRVMVARIGTEAGYGVFSLALVVLNVCTLIASLGLQQGAAQNIAYARGKNDTESIKRLIIASIQFGLLTSISLSIIVFFFAPFMAKTIFHDTNVILPLKIFALGIPFFTLIDILVSIFRGFNDIKPKVYFQDILGRSIFILLLLPFMFFKLSFDNVFYAFLASLIIPCAILVIYLSKRLAVPLRLILSMRASPVAIQLLRFSFPLLGVALLGFIITWTDTLMLGYFSTSAKVGLYNAAVPFAQFISAIVGAMLLIYMPVTSGLYARNMISEIKRNFPILTRWSCSVTFPLFLVLFIYPRSVLSFFFGADYVLADNALRILSSGFIISNFLGPNGGTLIALGRPRFLVCVTLGITLLNIGLNAAFIPRWGIEGAAIASAISIALANVVRCGKLYSLIGAQPLSKNLIKPMLASLLLVFLFHFIITNFFKISLWMLPLLFFLYYTIYGFAVLFTKSFGQEDIAILLLIEEKVGISISPIKKILRRFL